MTEKSIVNHVFVLQRNGNVNKDKGQPVQPFQPVRVPVQVPRRDAWVPSRTLYCTPLMDLSQIDGKVIFRVIIMLKMLLAISVQRTGKDSLGKVHFNSDYNRGSRNLFLSQKA